MSYYKDYLGGTIIRAIFNPIHEMVRLDLTTFWPKREEPCKCLHNILAIIMYCITINWKFSYNWLFGLFNIDSSSTIIIIE